MKKETTKTKDNKDLNQKIKECEKLRDEYLQGWQRERANFLNYKKREKERIEEEKMKMAKMILLEILKIKDAIELAEISLPKELKNSEWMKGFVRIREEFEKFFKEMGVEEMECLGKSFNPLFHEAVEITDQGKEGEIVEVFQKGYLFRGEVLRPARVKVGK